MAELGYYDILEEGTIITHSHSGWDEYWIHNIYLVVTPRLDIGTLYDEWRTLHPRKKSEIDFFKELKEKGLIREVQYVDWTD